MNGREPFTLYERERREKASVCPCGSEKGKYLRRTIIDYANPYGTHEQRDGVGSDRLRHTRSIPLSPPLRLSFHPLKFGIL